MVVLKWLNLNATITYKIHNSSVDITDSDSTRWNGIIWKAFLIWGKTEAAPRAGRGRRVYITEATCNKTNVKISISKVYWDFFY